MGRPRALTVVSMSDPASRLCCYLVEWYLAELSEEVLDRTLARVLEGAESLSTNGLSARVLMTLAVPTDEVIFCVFVASSKEVVAQACDRAGLPAERVTAAMAVPVT
jgi:hypothetical protein